MKKKNYECRSSITEWGSKWNLNHTNSTGSWTYNTTDTGGYTGTYTSPNYGTSTIWTSSSKPPTLQLEEDTVISFSLVDGSKQTLRLKEYILFMVSHAMYPSECKDLAEYKEKLGLLRI